ncbi:uncharacterized protein [Desmodus rotundus]|uniref:uncharacterized protein n=1 Tax=Desmodus rotundus TaxID=9430 RepID=UPI00238104C8|nr:uncharacterized protein LOC123479374 [Desmodus rotundus]
MDAALLSFPGDSSQHYSSFSRREGRSLFSVGPLPCPSCCRGLGPGCSARRSREAAGLELGPTRRHGVSWPGIARAREVGVGAERRSEQRRGGGRARRGRGAGTTLLADWRDWGCVSLSAQAGGGRPSPGGGDGGGGGSSLSRCPSGNATDRTGITSAGARGTWDTPPPAAPLASPPTAPHPLANSPLISGSCRGRLEKRLCFGAPALQRASARLLLEGRTVLVRCLSGKSPTIVNKTRTICVTSV